MRMLEDRWIAGEFHRLAQDEDLIVTVEWVSSLEANRIKVTKGLEDGALADIFFDEQSRDLSLEDFSERFLKPLVMKVLYG